MTGIGATSTLGSMENPCTIMVIQQLEPSTVRQVSIKWYNDGNLWSDKLDYTITLNPIGGGIYSFAELRILPD